MNRTAQNSSRKIMMIVLVLPCLLGLFHSNVCGQSYTITAYTPSTAKPDLQVAEMKYSSSTCTMYYRVANKGAATTKTYKLWINYYPVSNIALTAPILGSNSTVWLQQSMWQKTAYGTTTCGMQSVTKVRAVANARYTYKYYNSAWVIGDVLAPGTYAPAGWYVAEPQFSETSTTNNELTLPKSYIPLLTTTMTAVAVY